MGLRRPVKARRSFETGVRSDCGLQRSMPRQLVGRVVVIIIISYRSGNSTRRAIKNRNTRGMRTGRGVALVGKQQYKSVCFPNNK